MSETINTKDIRIRVFFYDGLDKDTGEYLQLGESFSEGYLWIHGNTIVPYDECSIIEWSFDAGKTWQR